MNRSFVLGLCLGIVLTSLAYTIVPHGWCLRDGPVAPSNMVEKYVRVLTPARYVNTLMDVGFTIYDPNGLETVEFDEIDGCGIHYTSEPKPVQLD